MVNLQYDENNFKKSRYKPSDRQEEERFWGWNVVSKS